MSIFKYMYVIKLGLPCFSSSNAEGHSQYDSKSAHVFSTNSEKINTDIPTLQENRQNN